MLAYRGREINPKTGKRQIVFKPTDGYSDLTVTLPCGQCIGCRLERSRQWAVRCIHEASLHEENCFITLTFSNEWLDSSNSLVKSDFQKFMKRLRKKFDVPIRYFHCGEYGEKLKRPHHHACLFGFDFHDKQLWSMKNGVKLYRSAALEKLWPYGFATIGQVTFESAAYVARYIMKKQTGKGAEEYYKDKTPPYTTMSRRPGIAHDWYAKYKDDVYPDDEIVIRDKLKVRPPRYYDSLYDLEAPEDFKAIKKKRIQKMNDPEVIRENSLSRLVVKEKCKKSQLKELKRTLHET